MRRRVWGLSVCRCVLSWIILWGRRGESKFAWGAGEGDANVGDSGHAAFLDPDVNKALKKVLNEWGKFLLVRLKLFIMLFGKCTDFAE